MNTFWQPKRLLALGAALAFALSMTLKLWGMTLTSTFYYNGLHLNIFATKVTGDLHELNILNHYIGMMNIDNSLPEFHWIPIVFAAVIMISLIPAIWPKRGILIGATILNLLGLGIMGGDFYYRLYEYGHDFAPDAAIQVPGFTPKIMGNYMLANFHVQTGFGFGGLTIVIGVVLLCAAIFSKDGNPVKKDSGNSIVKKDHDRVANVEKHEDAKPV
ncbi:Hypothetical protein DEACI_0712 [Acididesulfobacillus acetoxydans]|uniref:Uncharacterized protein n=1 Tax=Acididesulfobacillus acetoxydans TaxID=1561005 RepID=A0A8S0VVS4_9FIRM|nr:hypothetical protein [Acididesulfobacillus acetoxydans]CAA7600063.1 Hypothetical protein DEACI_0712 [Acididesulfobacillus acetoxydans]CEJ07838.1 Hypothetical protein DEACI_2304 [Acididesulfobacillus acetoxydans]